MKFEWWQIIIIAPVLTGCIILIGKTIHLRANKQTGELEVGENGEAKPKKRPCVNGPDNCINNVYFLRERREDRRILEQIWRIEKEILPKHKILIDRRIVRILSRMTSHYLFALKSKYNLEDLTKTDEYKGFNDILEIAVKYALKYELLERCIDNHFHEKDEDGMILYIREESTLIIDAINNVLNMIYPDSYKLSCTELFDVFSERLFPEIKTILNDFFNEARKISIAAYQRIQELEGQLAA